MTYDLTPMNAPRATGFTLDLAARLLENPLLGPMIAGPQLDGMGLARLRALSVSEPLPAVHPLFDGLLPAAAGPASAATAPAVPAPFALPDLAFDAPGFRFETAADFVEAYRSGRCTPLEVAERLLAIAKDLDRQDPPMRLFIAQRPEDVLAQAREATERYRRNAPLGPLDGVPVAVKDEVDQVPYPTTAGTRFLGKEPATRDAEAVSRLRAAGALLIGKTNMHELGLGVSGINPHHGAARNPYDPARMTGGSSSGTAATVAAGLAPLALGADGGGSIRLPAALCGVVGLKPTFGRISERGAAPICWSVAHLGPIAATVRDAALGYLVMAGPDDQDPPTRFQPMPHLTGLFDRDLRGIRLGLYPEWFEDADAAVVAACRQMLEVLRDAGAEIVEVKIPELGLMRLIHSLTIVTEMLAAHQQHYARHRADFGHEARVNFALLRQTRADDYLLAQRHRARLHHEVMAVMRTVDGLVTPATACTARAIGADALRLGESNLPLLDRLMRYMVLANLTGQPAIAFPAGYDPDGMPIGFQVIGNPWEEAFLLRIAHVAERHVSRQAPRIHHRLLGAREGAGLVGTPIRA